MVAWNTSGLPSPMMAWNTSGLPSTMMAWNTSGLPSTMMAWNTSGLPSTMTSRLTPFANDPSKNCSDLARVGRKGKRFVEGLCVSVGMCARKRASTEQLMISPGEWRACWCFFVVAAEARTVVKSLAAQSMVGCLNWLWRWLWGGRGPGMLRVFIGALLIAVLGFQFLTSDTRTVVGLTTAKLGTAFG